MQHEFLWGDEVSVFYNFSWNQAVLYRVWSIGSIAHPFGYGYHASIQILNWDMDQQLLRYTTQFKQLVNVTITIDPERQQFMRFSKVGDTDKIYIFH